MRDLLRGLVTHVNPPVPRIAISIAEYGWIVADVEGWADDVGIGDQISGVRREHGQQAVRNITRGTEVSIYVEAFDATPAARDALLR